MIQEQERLLLLVDLIAHDLKIHKHLHFLERSGLETFHLQLNIHDKIFRLAGINKTELHENLREWYYQMAEKAVETDVFEDERKLIEFSTEILVTLNHKRYTKT
jgi:hypothetical protein